MPNLLKSKVAHFECGVDGFIHEMISVKIEFNGEMFTVSGLSNKWHHLGEFDRHGSCVSVPSHIAELPVTARQIARDVIVDWNERIGRYLEPAPVEQPLRPVAAAQEEPCQPQE